MLAEGAYGLRLLTAAGIYALLAIGYQAVFGAAGALSLAQGAFFGFGAYVTGILGARHGVDGAITLVLSALGPMALAAIVAAPVLRLESHYFALATLGIAQLALLAGVNAESLTGGANGLSGVPGLTLFGVDVSRGWPLLAAVWGFAAVAGFLSWSWSKGARGRALALLREDPLAASALGIDTGALRLAAFLFAAGAGGLAGALHGHLLGVVSPEVLEFPVMIACLSMVVIGGRGNPIGAVLGALLLVQLPEFLRGIGPWYMVAYGAALLGVILFAPDGIAGAIARRLPKPMPVLPKPASPPAPRRAGASLSLRGVTKRFGGVIALNDLSLEIAPGALVGVIGPNGSGKTTLINAICGLYRPETGDVHLDGKSTQMRMPHDIALLGVARCFQAPRLLDQATALDNVALAARGSRRAEGLALHVLDRMGASEFALRPCAGLPGGVRRRVEIARALAMSPSLLLLDEPAAGLAPEEQADLAARLGALNAEGLTIVVVEHSVPFLKSLARRLVCLVEGRAVADGPPDEVTRNPLVVDAYLGRNWKRT